VYTHGATHGELTFYELSPAHTLKLSRVDHGELVRPAGGAHPVTVWNNALYTVVMIRLYCKKVELFNLWIYNELLLVSL